MDSSSGSCEVNACVSTLLSESIDAVLDNILGGRVKQTIYGCLERQGLRKYQIPEDLRGFDAFLEEKFGRGSGVIERQIARRLYASLGLELTEVPHFALADYVDIASRRLSQVKRLA
jgi:hypothetical protein